MAGGSGTQLDPYIIETPAELNNVRNNLSAYYKQAADIDLSGYSSGQGWVPIGTSSSSFLGSYDGDGYKITGLFINRASGYQGLFGRCDGQLANMHLESVDITGTTNVGGLVGYLGYSGSPLISNCHVTGDITGTQDVGGLAGRNLGSGGIADCSVDCNVLGTTGNVGGLVGYNEQSIVCCEARGTISSTTGRAGGLVGYNYGGSVSDCYSHSSITSTSGYAAGLVAQNEGTILRCYSTGSVSTGSTYRGGLVARNFGSVTGSYYDSQTSGQSDTGKGVPKTTAEMKTISTFSGWDMASKSAYVDETWWIDSGNDYPRLGWEFEPPSESYADVVISTQGGGAKQTQGGGASTIEISTQGGGSKLIQSGSASTIEISTQGGGSKLIQSGSASTIVISPQGSGSKRTQGGIDALVEISPQGSGSKRTQGGSEATMLVRVEGGGSKLIQSGSASTIVISPQGGGSRPLLGPLFQRGDGDTFQMFVEILRTDPAGSLDSISVFDGILLRMLERPEIQIRPPEVTDVICYVEDSDPLIEVSSSLGGVSADRRVEVRVSVPAGSTEAYAQAYADAYLALHGKEQISLTCKVRIATRIRFDELIPVAIPYLGYTWSNPWYTSIQRKIHQPLANPPYTELILGDFLPDDTEALVRLLKGVK
jgi:hypothetical protein